MLAKEGEVLLDPRNCRGMSKAEKNGVQKLRHLLVADDSLLQSVRLADKLLRFVLFGGGLVERVNQDTWLRRRT